MTQLEPTSTAPRDGMSTMRSGAPTSAKRGTSHSFTRPTGCLCLQSQRRTRLEALPNLRHQGGHELEAREKEERK